MNCCEASRRLPALLRGASDERVARHVETCAECREEAEQLRLILPALDEAARMERSVAADVRLRVLSEADKPDWAQVVTHALAALGAAALLWATTPVWLPALTNAASYLHVPTTPYASGFATALGAATLFALAFAGGRLLGASEEV